MDDIKSISIAKEISHMIMVESGYDPDTYYSSVEFDFDNPDSQISMIYETVLKTVKSIQDIEYLSNRLLDAGTQPISLQSQEPGVTSVAYFSVMLRENSTFQDLKNFVSHLERMGLDDSALVKGSMTANIDLDSPQISRIECGECGYMDYLVEPIDHESSLG
jgi:hypothetical protein